MQQQQAASHQPMATGSPRGAAALAGLMTDPSPAAEPLRAEGGPAQEIGVGDHPLARAGLGSAGSAEGGVGGANLIRDGGAPAREYDWTIPAEELEALGNVPAMERRALEVLPPWTLKSLSILTPPCIHH